MGRVDDRDQPVPPVQRPVHVDVGLQPDARHVAAEEELVDVGDRLLLHRHPERVGYASRVVVGEEREAEREPVEDDPLDAGGAGEAGRDQPAADPQQHLLAVDDDAFDDEGPDQQRGPCGDGRGDEHRLRLEAAGYRRLRRGVDAHESTILSRSVARRWPPPRGSAGPSRSRSPTSTVTSTARRSTTWRGASPGAGGWCSSTAVGPTRHWWTHIAATFADEFRVVAVDLSGHGDSDHRDVYDLEQWTDEVMPSPADGGDRRAAGGRRPQHGRVRHDRHRGAARPDGVAGVIVCDSPVTKPDPEVASYRLKEAFGRPRTYPSVDGRGRPFPHGAAPGALPRLRDRPRRPAVAAAGRRRRGSGSSTAASSSSSPRGCGGSRCRTSHGCAAASPCCGPSAGS